MTLQELGLFIVAVLISVCGQFLLKLGALKLGKVNADNVVSHLLGMIMVPELLIGLMCYGLGAIVYILLLTRVNLSVAGPAVALSYIFSVLLGYFVFREAIPLERVLGLGFIVFGVILVVWQKQG